MRFITNKLATAGLIALFNLGALSQNPSAATPPMQVESGKVIQFLSQTVSWYHQRAAEQKLATDASDLAYAQENRRVADQVVPLAFEYARNQAQIQGKQTSPQPAIQPSDSTGQSQRLTLQAVKLDKEIQDTQTELQDARDKLAKSSPTKRNFNQSLVAELQ